MSAPTLSAASIDAPPTFKRLIGLLEEAAVPGLDVQSLVCDDTHFRDLGIDSMTMIRFVGDIEDEFGITIDTSDALIAFSFQRLVELIDSRVAPVAQAGEQGPGQVGTGRVVDVSTYPQTSPYVVEQGTLLQVMAARAAAKASNGELRFVSLRGDSAVFSHERFLRMSGWLAGQIPAATTSGPRILLIVAIEPFVMLQAFCAGLAAGLRPLILPPPKSLGGTEALVARLRTLEATLGEACTIAIQDDLELDADLDLPMMRVPREAAAYGELAELPQGPDAAATDVAFLQSTGGSTGEGKLVAVTHANALANLAALRSCLGMGEQERVATWLPLYHDMGLLGGALFSLVNAYDSSIMKPTDFIKRPARWLKEISDTRATFSGAPNFALDYVAKMVPASQLEGLDLSSIRRFGVAAEPITLGAVTAFVNHLAPFGLDPASLVPGLGMAEATIAATTRAGAGDPRYLVIDSRTVQAGTPVKILAQGYVRYPAEDVPAGDGVPVFALGWALPGMTVGLIDDSGQEITADGVLGEITVAGPSVVQGYYDLTTHTSEPFSNDTHLSGDLGFFEGGDLFVVGRRKNVLIRRGQNFVASLLEVRIGEILGASPVTVMLVDADINDPDSDVVVLAEASGLMDLSDQQRRDLRALELPVDVVHLSPGLMIPRTTSAKKKYHAARAGLAEGTLPVMTTIRLNETVQNAG